MAGAAHLLGDGQSGWTRSDDSDPLSRLDFRPGDREPTALLAIPVAKEGFQLADCDRLGVLAHDARAFAERLLGTEPTAQFGHLGRLAEHGRSVGQLANLKEGQRAGNVVADRTGLRAWRSGTLNTALGFKHRRTGGVAVVDLVPVVDAIMRGLLGDVMRRNTQALAAIDRLAGARELLLLDSGPGVVGPASRATGRSVRWVGPGN